MYLLPGFWTISQDLGSLSPKSRYKAGIYVLIPVGKCTDYVGRYTSVEDVEMRSEIIISIFLLRILKIVPGRLKSIKCT